MFIGILLFSVPLIYLGVALKFVYEMNIGKIFLINKHASSLHE